MLFINQEHFVIAHNIVPLVQSLCQKRCKERYLCSRCQSKVLLDYFKIVSAPDFKVQAHLGVAVLVRLIPGWKIRVCIPKPNVVCSCLFRCHCQPLDSCLLFLWLPCPGLLWLLLLPFRLPLPAMTALVCPYQTNLPRRIWPLWPICSMLHPSSIGLGISKHLSEDLDIVLGPTKRFCRCCNPWPSLISAQLLYGEASSSNR